MEVQQLHRLGLRLEDFGFRVYESHGKSLLNSAECSQSSFWVQASRSPSMELRLLQGHYKVTTRFNGFYRVTTRVL